MSCHSTQLAIAVLANAISGLSFTSPIIEFEVKQCFKFILWRVLLNLHQQSSGR
jgi:hypothetical protein